MPGLYTYSNFAVIIIPPYTALTEYVRQLVVLSEWSNAQKQQIGFLEGTVSKKTLCRQLTLPGSGFCSLTPPGASSESMEVEGDSDSESPSKSKMGRQSLHAVPNPRCNPRMNTDLSSSPRPRTYNRSHAKSRAYTYSDLKAPAYSPTPPSYPPPPASYPPRPPSYPPSPSPHSPPSPHPRLDPKPTSKDGVSGNPFRSEPMKTERSNSSRPINALTRPRSSDFATSPIPPSNSSRPLNAQTLLRNLSEPNPRTKSDGAAASSDVGGDGTG